MAIKKYISTKEAMRLTGLSKQEIYDLIHEGELPAHKAPKSGWRISQQDLEMLGLIHEESSTKFDASQIKNYAVYIDDEEHYTEVFKRMTEVKYSLKIATGDLKNFNVYIKSAEGEKKLRLCDFFLSLVERGVQVQVVCMKPEFFYNYTKEKCPQLLDNPLFELRKNKHNHMKIFIFDEDCAYIGSANITEAAIGKSRSNHEAGMLLCGAAMVHAPARHFEKSWNDPDILKITWKRFVKKAKVLEKEMKEKYGK